MASVRQRYNKWEARVRIPKALEENYGGRQHLSKTLEATDRRTAKLEAAAWEVSLKAEWSVLQSRKAPPSSALRPLYDTLRRMAEEGEFVLEGDPRAPDAIAAGIDHELDKMADQIGERALTQEERAKVWALNDASGARRGLKVKQRAELEVTFGELAEEHLRLWRIAPGRKVTNTEQQKAATFNLFASYFGDKPIRQVSRADASAFVDALRQLDPDWARTGKARGESKPMTWQELQRAFGGRSQGLSDATVNRHMATLSALWRWAEERENCEGRNPFDGHRRKLKDGRNKQGYVAWEPEELRRLFDPPPKRSDLTEVMVVAMFTGMRLNEIASLTFGQIREEGGIRFLDVTDAKTAAGERRVPLHPRLGWLAERAEGAQASERVWPKFSPEGPGRKPGGDAGKEFSRFKRSRGFEDRRKVFHSFRKNVVGQLERARVPQNEVAQLVGHEKQGLTFGVYGDMIPLERLAEIVGLIDYPDVPLP